MPFTPPEEPVTAEAFAAFSGAAADGGRYELLEGCIFAMGSERAVHARAKNAVLRQLEHQIAQRALPCEAFPDGMAVHVDEMNVFEPDVTLRCGPRLPGDATFIADPLLVVEVASPSTQRIDVLVKFARYFRNASVIHYLIVVPTGGIVIHHRCTADGRIEATSYEGGTILLDPPGLELDLAALRSAMI